MGLFSSNKSWTNQAKEATGSRPRSGLFGNPNRRKRCPPVTDCDVKQSLMASAQEQRLWGVRTKKEVRQAKQLAAQIARQQRAGRKTKSWPYAGSYDPNKGKARGK